MEHWPASEERQVIILLLTYVINLKCVFVNKDRFCNIIATVALIDASIQSDWRLQTKGILSTNKSKQTWPQKLPGNQWGKLSLCDTDRCSLRDLCAYDERRRVNLKFCLADFGLIQNFCGNCFI